MRETWYVMEDGSFGDPRAIAPGKDGRLVHKDGRKVAYASHGPRSRSVDTASAGKRKPFHDGDGKPGGAKPKVEDDAPADVGTPEGVTSTTSDMEAEQPAPTKRGRPYKTRESKAD